MLLALTRGLTQGLCGMLAHQCILDQYVPTSSTEVPSLSRIGLNSFPSFLTKGLSLSGMRKECEVKMRNKYKGEEHRDIRSA